MEIIWHGHGTFQINGAGKVVYTDPYVLKDDAVKADFILVTHGHYDHCDIEKIEKIRKSETIVIAEEKAAAKISGAKPIKSGQKIDLGDIKVLAVPSYNPQKVFHPKGFGIGFIIEIEEKRIYQAGDTDVIEEMKDLGDIDVALLPAGGKYTMDLSEALEAVRYIKPTIAIPYHYNTLDGLELTPKELSNFKSRVEQSTSTKVELLDEKIMEM
ncbi:MAG: MBL fold metallo-hydrolase [Candidatus Altiarchaeota archaeon]